jgi:anthrone oxygenase-like protein
VVLETFARLTMQLTAGAFAGACLYILLVQHPVRTALGGAQALADFRAAIPRAEKVQAPLLVGCLAAVGLHLAVASSWPVAVGGLLMLVVLLQTLATVLPINRRLLSGTAADRLAEAPAALARWGTLHALRTVLAVLGAVALLL